MSKLSKWLRAQMTKKKMRQHHLALAVGVSDTAVSKWRDGINIPDAVSLAKLAEIFRVDAVWLMKLAGIPLGDGVKVPANSLFLAEFEHLSDDDKNEIMAMVQFKAKRNREKGGKK